jgi:formylglycine-generating enzyme required for sulfatase activity
MHLPKIRYLLLLLWGSLIFLQSPAASLGQEVLEAQGLRFRLIPGGTYTLGSPLNEPGRYTDEALPNPVVLKPFYLAETETTNAQYGRFLGATGHREPLYWQDKNLNQPSQPVVGVTWDDAQAFCRWLTRLTGVEHRLPTEAQWEAAARGGIEGGLYPWGNQPPESGGGRRANFSSGTPPPPRYRFTTPAGHFLPNGYGLYDMAGNVAEWCQDRYISGDGGRSFQPPQARVLKGGSFLSQVRDLRCAARQYAPAGYADGFIGFRVTRVAP